MLLAASIGGLMYLIVIEQQYISSIYVLIVIVFQLIEFIRYVDKTNRDLNSLFVSILNGDFQTSFNTWKRGSSYRQLYKSLAEINQKFQDISTAREVQFRFLETLIAHLRVALISFDKDENINLINESAKKLLNKPVVSNLSSIEQASIEIATVCRIITPDKPQLVKTVLDGDMISLAVRCSEFKLENKLFKLVTLQNIKNEMEAQEVESWQKLIRVLTHEIMNSVAPITSLSDTLHGMVEQHQLHNTNDSVWINSLITGLEAIKTRSLSLQRFTEAYQSLTRLPKPFFETKTISTLFAETRLLFAQVMADEHISFKISCNPNLEYLYDKSMISQVLVNLIKNSVEALEGRQQKTISLSAFVDDGLLHISVKDNGAGIAPEHLENVFVPFFTTKEQGSGIGLALSRQILQLHNGRIVVKSIPKTGTEVILEL